MTDYKTDKHGRLLEDTLINGKLYRKHAFAPGKSGNPNGRPKKKKPVETNTAKLYEITQQANGDPIELKKLMLENAGELKLDVDTINKISTELANYVHSKKGSEKAKEDRFERIEVRVILPQEYEILQRLYEHHSDVFDANSIDKLLEFSKTLDPKVLNND